jgi:beta-N-acetylhexosaminidase
LPSPARIGELAAMDEKKGLRTAFLSARLLAEDLYPLGFSVDCIPCVDVRRAETHAFLRDRTYSEDGRLVAELGRATINGLAEGGIQPTIKHIPGHGRAQADSHESMPAVDAGRRELESDFAPFRALRDVPWAMTAHVIYRAIDPRQPATMSSRVIGDVIRERIGFAGALVSDDLGMGALSGTLAARTGTALGAGCDVALHCKGDMAEMEQVMSAVPVLAGASWRRVQAALKARPKRIEADCAALAAELTALLEG